MTDKILTVSWSKLRAWDHCKQKAHLQSQGIHNKSTNTRVFFKGTVADRILRDWVKDTNRQPGIMPGMVDEYFDLCEKEQIDNGAGVVRWRHINDRVESADWCRELLTTAEPLVNSLLVPYFPDVYADKYLTADVVIPGLDDTPTKIRLLGYLDILINTPDFFAIYDLKATADENYYKKTIMQLVFYYILAASSYKRIPDVTALIQPMCREQVKYIVINDEHVLTLMQKIIAYAHSVWRQDFTPKASDAGCLSWCEVSHACAKFQKQSDGRLSWR